MSEAAPITGSAELFETTPPTVEELTRAYIEVAAAATGRRINIDDELEISQKAYVQTSFIERAYCDLMHWASKIESSSLIGPKAAISPAILGFQRDAIAQAETILETMNAEDRTRPTPEEERALAARYYYWRMARHEWQDDEEARP